MKTISGDSIGETVGEMTGTIRIESVTTEIVEIKKKGVHDQKIKAVERIVDETGGKDLNLETHLCRGSL